MADLCVHALGCRWGTGFPGHARRRVGTMGALVAVAAGSAPGEALRTVGSRVLRVRAGSPLSLWRHRGAGATLLQPLRPSTPHRQPTTTAPCGWAGGRKSGASAGRARRAHERCSPGPERPAPGSGYPGPTPSHPSPPQGLWPIAGDGDGQFASQRRRFDGEEGQPLRGRRCAPRYRARYVSGELTPLRCARAAGPEVRGHSGEPEPPICQPAG